MQTMPQYQDKINKDTISNIKESQPQCPICLQPTLEILINNALYYKYLDTETFHYIRYVERIMDDDVCPDTIQHKEMMVRDENEEFMRRFYSMEQYEYKNRAITEYYKFHKDYPKLHQNGIDRIMERFYEKKKEVQYKKIKRILKQEEDISITTQKSSQIFSDIEQQEKKSHFSNILSDLTQNNDTVLIDDDNQSQVLKYMCKKIQKAYQNRILSPIANSKTKTIFSQNANKQKLQLKNFTNYLKKQTQKKQQKYKNFIRSNKESKYNSIEQETLNKQFNSTSISNSVKMIKNITKRQYQNKKVPFFYDGKQFFNANNNLRTTFLNSKKEQRTKEQTNTPSYDHFDLEIHTLTANNNHGEAFRKNKQSYKNSINNDRIPNSNKPVEARGLQTSGRQNDRYSHNYQQELISRNRNLKQKAKEKTIDEIYTNANQEFKIKKRSISYNSLGVTNSTKKGFILGNQALKEKDFQIRNRISYQQQKNRIISLTQKETDTNFKIHQTKLNNENKGSLLKTRSSSNIKRASSLGKFSSNRQFDMYKDNNMQKIIIPKEMIRNLKGKSLSTSKLKHEVNRQSANDRQQSNPNNLFGKTGLKQRKSNKNLINLFGESTRKTDQQQINVVSAHNSANNIDIDNLLRKKLILKVQTKKNNQNNSSNNNGNNNMFFNFS